MKMKPNKAFRNVTVGLSLLLIISTAAHSDDKKSPKKAPPDLSGTWILDEAKSNTGSGKDRISGYTLTIVCNGPQIRMSKKFKLGDREIADDVVYYTDGRPEYSSRTGRSDSNPIVRWRGAKLVRISRTGLNELSFVYTEEWQLSKDGQTLIRNTSQTAGSVYIQESKFIFNRKS